MGDADPSLPDNQEQRGYLDLFIKYGRDDVPFQMKDGKLMPVAISNIRDMSSLVTQFEMSLRRASDWNIVETDKIELEDLCIKALKVSYRTRALIYRSCVDICFCSYVLCKMTSTHDVAVPFLSAS